MARGHAQRGTFAGVDAVRGTVRLRGLLVRCGGDIEGAASLAYAALSRTRALPHALHSRDTTTQLSMSPSPFHIAKQLTDSQR